MILHKKISNKKYLKYIKINIALIFIIPLIVALLLSFSNISYLNKSIILFFTFVIISILSMIFQDYLIKQVLDMKND